MTLEQVANKQLLEYAVGRQITCRRCESRHVLDARDSVLITAAGREVLTCGAQYDDVKLALADTAAREGWKLEVVDGRELYPAPRRAARKPLAKPQTAQERHARIVAALTAYDRRGAARAASNARYPYNRYALGLSLQALERAERMIGEGDLVPVALGNVFTGALLKAVLKAIGEVA